MKEKETVNIGLDFHGTIFDHRLAKYLHFKEIGAPYSSPYIDRNKILEELSPKGYGQEWYFETLSEFFKLEGWNLSGEISSGLHKFLLEAPQNWRFIVFSGLSSNLLAIRRIIAYSGLPRISGVYRVSDEQKAEICKYKDIKLYFDDKIDIFESFANICIKCIHVSTEGYSNLSRFSSINFNNWHEVCNEIAKVRALITKGSSPANANSRSEPHSGVTINIHNDNSNRVELEK